jgi:hypothetical protein
LTTETTSCPHCSEPLPDDADPHFCPSCGEPLEPLDLARTIATPALTVKGRGMTIPMPSLDPSDAQDTTANPQIQRPPTTSPLQEAARALKRTEPLLPATQVLTPLLPEGELNIDISPTYADDLQAQDRVVATAPDRGALDVAHLQTQLFSSVDPSAHPRTALVQPLTATPSQPPPRQRGGLGLALLATALLILLLLALFTFLYLLLRPSPLQKLHNAPAPPPISSSTTSPPPRPSPPLAKQHNVLTALQPSSPTPAWTLTRTLDGPEATLWLSSLPILRVPTSQSTQALQALQLTLKNHQEGRGLVRISACEDELCVIWRRGRQRIQIVRVEASDPAVSLFQAQHLSAHLADIMDLLVSRQRPVRRLDLVTSRAVNTWLSLEGSAEQRLGALSAQERHALSFSWPRWPQE